MNEKEVVVNEMPEVVDIPAVEEGSVKEIPFADNCMEANPVLDDYFDNLEPTYIPEQQYGAMDYAVAGLAIIGGVALLAGAGFGIYKGVKFIKKKVDHNKQLVEELNNARELPDEDEEVEEYE